jgi:uncharacterized protein HemY
MNTLLFTGVTIVFVVVVCFLVDILITSIINLTTRSNQYHEGMIFNSKNNKLEDDNGEINVL